MYNTVHTEYFTTCLLHKLYRYGIVTISIRVGEKSHDIYLHMLNDPSDMYVLYL